MLRKQLFEALREENKMLKEEVDTDNRTLVKKLGEAGVGAEHFFGACMSSLFIGTWECILMPIIPMPNIWQERVFISPAVLRLRKRRSKKW